MYILISIFAGAITTISNALNSGLGEKIGKFQGVLVNFLSGFCISLLFLIFNFESIKGFSIIKTVPIYLLLGGFLGIGIVVLNNLVIPKIPIIYVSLLVFIGQIFTGIIIDKLMTNSLSLGKVVGVLFIAFGLYINILIDKKSALQNKL